VDYSTVSARELVFACMRSGEDSAWVEFVRRFQPLVASVVLRVARQWGEATPQLIDDLIQETYLKLCANRIQVLEKIRVGHQDAVYGFVKVFTANLAQDHFKASRAQKRGGSTGTYSLDADPATDRAIRVPPDIRSLERRLLLEQVAAWLEATVAGPNAERDRRIFWLYYRTGLSASAIAALPTIELSTKGVESTIMRLTRTVRQYLAPRNSADSPISKADEGIRSSESF
jgi:RNA polymerase sigma-70 factor, ECF subfamily